MPALLDLPDVRQQSDYDCGIAAALCVLRYLGADRLRRDVEATLGATRLDGTDPRAMEAMFRREGLAVQSGTMALADLAYHAGRGRPVVCLVTRGGTAKAPGAHPGAVGHYVVSAGVRRGFVHVHDPVEGPGRVRTAEFLSRWADWDRHGQDWQRFAVAVSRFA